MMPAAWLSTPLGPLSVISDGESITRLRWRADDHGPVTPELGEALRQLAAYFEGRLTRFELPLRVGGTDFQRKVCAMLCDIPHGETRTYGDLAKCCGASARAVGSACGGNRIPVIIPCHRVLGSGSLGGFSGAGGVETKVWLLRHEGAAGLLI